MTDHIFSSQTEQVSYCEAHWQRLKQRVPAFRVGLCARCYSGKPLLPPGVLIPERFKHTLSQRLATSRKMLQSWRNPQIRARRIAAMRRAIYSAEVRRKISEGVRLAFNWRAVRERHRKGCARAMNDPEFRSRLAAAARRRWAKQSERARQRERTLRAWKDPAKRSRMLAAIARANRSRWRARRADGNQGNRQRKR